MTTPTVSVIIPCFNAETTLARAVRSALKQDCVREVIVSDDGSSDGSEAIAGMFGEEVRFITGPNGGAPSARNRGSAAAISPFVLFLDSDDYIDDCYIDSLAACASFDTQVVLGSYRRVSTEGMVFDEVTYRQGLTPSQALAEYLNRPTQTSAFLWQRAFLADLGGWDESLAIYQDAELTMRGLLQATNIQVCGDNQRFAYWLDNDADHRLSTRFTETKAQSTLRALDRHRAAIMALQMAPAAKGLAARYYSLARLSYKHGHGAVGDDALGAYRHLGLRGHEGSLAHQLGCSILGLRRKMSVTHAMSQLRARSRSRSRGV